MMTSRFDVIVAGLGAMGSAVTLELARRGLTVAGFDRYSPPHTLGSSHGGSRIIREAYFEHPLYVPLVQRAYESWSALEQQCGETLYLRTGGLMIGAPGCDLVEGSLASARLHGLAHEVLEAASIRERYPALHARDDMVGVFEPRAGILFPERCIAAQMALAASAGAALHRDEPIVRWEPEGEGVRVFTAHRELQAKTLVVATGAWLEQLVDAPSMPLAIERQVLYWFKPRSNAAAFLPERCPIHLWQFERGEFFYGFPELGQGIKLARHHHGATTTADTIDRVVGDDEVDDIRMLARRFVPDAEGELQSSAVCMYTNTPDEHFRIDWLDGRQRVLVVSACSGHGFKFAPVIGEIAADLATNRESAFDRSLFRLR